MLVSRVLSDSTARVAAFALGVRRQLSWRVTGELGWVMAGQAAALLGSVGLTKIVASRLGTEQYGRLALGLTAAVFLNQFLFGPVTVSAVRYFSAYRETGRLAPFIRALAKMALSATALVLVVLVPVTIVIFERRGWQWAALVALASVFGIFQNVFGLFNGLDAAARNRVRVAAHQAADPALRLVFAAAALWALSRSAVAAMLGMAIAMGLTMGSQVLLFRRTEVARSKANDATDGRAPGSDERAITKTLVGYSKYFLIAGIFTWLQLSSDRWALKMYLDDSAVGLYAAAFQLASVPGVVLAGCLSQFFSPIVFQRASDGASAAGLRQARQAIMAGTLLLSALVLGSTAVATIIGEPLIVMLTSPAYGASGPYLAPLVLGLGLLQIGHMLSLVPLSTNRLRGHLVVRIVHGSVATLMNILGAKHFGVAGLCVASILGGLIYIVLALLNNARIMRTTAWSRRPPSAAAVAAAMTLESSR